mgnify:CR=1 FL=1
MENYNEQENFWIGDFGDDMVDRYRDRDFNGAVKSNNYHFKKIIDKTENVKSLIELGCNLGINLHAISKSYPSIELTGVDINPKAIELLSESNICNTICSSMFDLDTSSKYDVVLTKAALIHINPNQIKSIYKKIYELSNKYICLCEFYNPTPAEVVYRGNKDVMYQRDFAGEFLDLHPNSKLIDYGFMYHRDPSFPENDVTWFLIEK